MRQRFYNRHADEGRRIDVDAAEVGQIAEPEGILIRWLQDHIHTVDDIYR